jgi:hypothetical protein
MDANGRKTSEDEKRTAGDPVGIRLTTRTGPGGLRADGSDMALIDMEVIDAAGNRCPTALNLINFRISGPAEWRGGIAQGPDNYILAKSLPVENGVNRVIVRSLPVAGRITIRATPDKLKAASIELISRQVKVADGLSLEMPAEGLRSNLERGATPPPTPLVNTRHAVLIAGATAGANADRASKSYDDDETTDWSNDGNRSTGWIKYEFAKPATVSEVTLKFAGWRTQSYPIRITVDDKEVFAGQTPRSLGYVTIKFAAMAGRSMKIELTGSASNRDAFGNIIEIPGTPDPQSAAGRKPSNGTLGIVEAEIYEAVVKDAN